MLEKEEEDFANQIRKQKSFLQSVFREKEELAQLCVNQTAKLAKLESERMEWQRKIIMTEREKRDHLEKLDKEKQDHQQSVKKFEKVKCLKWKMIMDYPKNNICNLYLCIEMIILFFTGKTRYG
jgi:hypothetical protein